MLAECKGILSFSTKAEPTFFLITGEGFEEMYIDIKSIAKEFIATSKEHRAHFGKFYKPHTFTLVIHGIIFNYFCLCLMFSASI